MFSLEKCKLKPWDITTHAQEWLKLKTGTPSDGEIVTQLELFSNSAHMNAKGHSHFEK